MAQRISNQYLPRLLLLRQQETTDTKVCNTCESILPLTSFYKGAREYKGVYGRCKDCHKQYLASRKPRERELRLQHKYGMSAEDYEQLATAQGYCCAICDKAYSGHPSSDELLVDHDHSNGQVRGLLCSSCNVGIGHFRDNVSLLLGAIGYLVDPPANGVITNAHKQDAQSSDTAVLVQPET